MRNLLQRSSRNVLSTFPGVDPIFVKTITITIDSSRVSVMQSTPGRVPSCHAAIYQLAIVYKTTATTIINVIMLVGVNGGG